MAYRGGMADMGRLRFPAPRPARPWDTGTVERHLDHAVPDLLEDGLDLWDPSACLPADPSWDDCPVTWPESETPEPNGHEWRFVEAAEARSHGGVWTASAGGLGFSSEPGASVAGGLVASGDDLALVFQCWTCAVCSTVFRPGVREPSCGEVVVSQVMDL